MTNIKENNYYTQVKISGWTKSKFVETNLTYPENINQIIDVLRFAKNKKKRIAIRGRGCSFGDQSYIKNEITCDLSKFNKIINFDSKNQLITVESGISLIEIYKHILSKNFILESTPGGLQVSVGGAISNNIHGKDCFKNGYFNENVSSIKYLDSNLKIHKIKFNKNNSNKLNNIFGGIGLFYLILEVTLHLKKKQSLVLQTHTKRVNNIDSMIKNFENLNTEEYDYAIGWIDCFSRDKKIGRGLFRTATFINKNYNQSILEKKISIQENKKKFLFLPQKITIWILSKIYCRFLFKLANSIIFSFSSLGFKKVNFIKFIWIDNNFIPNYPDIFIKKGLFTIQPFVPTKDANKNIKKILLICQKYKFEGILCPIKKYKKAKITNELHFSGDGYSIVLDIPINKNFNFQFKYFIDEISTFLSKINGRIYLTKDLHLDKKNFTKLFPNFNDFVIEKNICDNNNLFATDQYLRLMQK